MQDEAKRMRAQVDDLMSLSRIEAERFAVPSHSIDLMSVIETVKSSVATLVEARGSELIVENDAEATIVAGDRSQLVQMLCNLVTNALNYGRPERRSGSRWRRPEVSCFGSGSSIRVRAASEHIPR